ncbi:hypothetical protein V6R21_02785 [Limibacter armeniacum]|uniref:hypothetical protein n=1 Tax=Limibacter armeniacum TaxID=466084 RepID=UPI002FE6A298
MKLLFTVKQLGKKKPLLTKKSLELPLEINQERKLMDILEVIVKNQVQSFNEKREDQFLSQLLEGMPISKSDHQSSLLNDDEMAEQAESGKLTFGHIENTKLADEQKAIQTMKEAFDDGLFAVFHNAQQIEKADQLVCLQEEDEFIFIRLTFLSGSMY